VRTLLRTTQAHGLIAAAAAGRALLTKSVVAEAAVVTVFAIYGVSTLITRFTFPIGKGNVWTIRAVSIEDSLHYREEITYPALFQGRPYCAIPFSLTQPVPSYMRMGYVFGWTCRMRVECNAIKGAVSIKLRQLV
jgi:hypothetical protein